MEYATEIAKEADQYNGFNLVLADVHSGTMVYISNKPGDAPVVQTVSPGCHVLSNAAIDSPWPKVQATTVLIIRSVIFFVFLDSSSLLLLHPSYCSAKRKEVKMLEIHAPCGSSLSGSKLKISIAQFNPPSVVYVKLPFIFQFMMTCFLSQFSCSTGKIEQNKSTNLLMTLSMNTSKLVWYVESS